MVITFALILMMSQELLKSLACWWFQHKIRGIWLSQRVEIFPFHYGVSVRSIASLSTLENLFVCKNYVPQNKTSHKNPITGFPIFHAPWSRKSAPHHETCPTIVTWAYQLSIYVEFHVARLFPYETHLVPIVILESVKRGRTSKRDGSISKILSFFFQKRYSLKQSRIVWIV